jgi:hypothetical protein
VGFPGDYRGERSALQHQTTHGLFSAPCAPKKNRGENPRAIETSNGLSKKDLVSDTEADAKVLQRFLISHYVGCAQTSASKHVS